MKVNTLTKILKSAIESDVFVDDLIRDQSDIEAIIQSCSGNVITLEQYTPTGTREYEITVSVKRTK